jgi:hypothetical protein
MLYTKSLARRNGGVGRPEIKKHLFFSKAPILPRSQEQRRR